MPSAGTVAIKCARRVSGDASGAEIGEEEGVVPGTEEEVVVSKRLVAKEEVRAKEDVLEDTEVCEEVVRREEIDAEDDTSSRRPRRLESGIQTPSP